MWSLVFRRCYALTVLTMLAISGAVHARMSIDDALTSDPVVDDAFPAAVVEFSIGERGERMPGHAYLAAGVGPHPTVVLLHGLPGNERNLDIAQSLRRFGFNVVYFHYRGAWGAEGEYRFSQLPVDALRVLAYLRDEERVSALRIDTQALSFLGHSLGGYTALAAAARDPMLRCTVSLSPANLAVWQAGVVSKAPETQGLADYADQLFMLEGFTGARLLEELAFVDTKVWDTRGFAQGLRGKNVLMIVGESDAVTPPALMFDPVVSAYTQDGRVRLTAKKIPGDHSFSQSRMRLTREILSWMDTRCRGPVAP